MLANKILSQSAKLYQLVKPVADAFASTVSTSPVNVSEAHAVTFVYYKGVGTTGTATITVEACDDTVPTTTSAVPFRYTVSTSSDTYGALTAATTAGFTTTAGSNHTYLIHVDADLLALSGYKYVRLKSVEVVDDPILGGIMVIMHPLRKDRAANAQSTILS